MSVISPQINNEKIKETLKYSYSEETLALYDEIVKEYRNLINRIVELIAFYGYKDPIEVSCLFSHILAKNSIYTFENSEENMQKNSPDILETPEIIGAATLIGGKCRNKSAMLVDILHKMDIEALFIAGYITNYLLLGNFIPLYGIDIALVAHIQEMLQSGKSANGIYSEIRKLKLPYRIISAGDADYLSNPIKKNHTIVLAGTDKKIFIDQEQNAFYFPVPREKITLRNYTGTYVFITPPQFGKVINKYYYGDRSRVKAYQHISALLPSSESETIKLKNATNNHLQNNSAPIETFIEDNKHIISDIGHKCLTLKNSITR